MTKQTKVNPETIGVKVSDLREGDMVDLESCPHLSHHIEAEFEYGVVDEIVIETTHCIVINYESGLSAGYDPEEVLQVRTTPDRLDKARTEAADAAYVNHDFEPNMVTDSTAWNKDGDEWTRVLSMDDDDHNPYSCGFIVRFRPGGHEVAFSCAGDRH